MADPIKITGLKEFQRGLKAMDRGLPKQLRLVLNDAANVVVHGAKPSVPMRTGRARASVKAASTQKLARVSGGGNKVPYYPWLDFGGHVGIHNSVSRPFLAEGRYIYPAYRRDRNRFVEALRRGLVKLAESSGIAVG